MPTRRDRRLAALGGDDPGVPPPHGASSSDVLRPEQCSTCSEASRRSLHIAAVRSRSCLSGSPTLYSELRPQLPPPPPRLPLMVLSRTTVSHPVNKLYNLAQSFYRCLKGF